MFGNNVNLVCTDDDTPPYTSSVSDLIRRQRKQKEDTISKRSRTKNIERCTSTSSLHKQKVKGIRRTIKYRLETITTLFLNNNFYEIRI